MKKITTQSSEQRTLSVLFYLGVLCLLNNLINGQWLPPSGATGAWVYAAITYWLLVLISAPFFEAPRDALVTALLSFLLVATISETPHESVAPLAKIIFSITIAVSMLSMVAAIVSLTLYPRVATLGPSLRVFQLVCYRFSNSFGSGSVLLSLAAVYAILVGYGGQINSLTTVLAFWMLVVLLDPISRISPLVQEFLKSTPKDEEPKTVGLVLRVDDPGLVRFEITSKDLGIEGELTEVSLREGWIAQMVVLFVQQQGHRQCATGLVIKEHPGVFPKGLVLSVKGENDGWELVREHLNFPAGLKLCGFVIEQTNTRRLRFEKAGSQEIVTGALVVTHVGKLETYFQVLDTFTDEEYFDGNPRGTHVVEAIQLGQRESRGFKMVQSTARMNYPVFIVPAEATESDQMGRATGGTLVVGSVPGTAFPISASLNKLMEQHCAILGVTGTGKTELAFDLIRTALEEQRKVICVDITGDYKHRLSDLDPELISLPPSEQENLDQAIAEVEEGDFGGAKEKRELRKLIQNTIDPLFSSAAQEFLDSDDHCLAILELDSIANTRASLRATEVFLSAVFDWARKHRGHDGVLVVLEEAHTLVPETNYFGYDRVDTLAVIGRMAQVALQGRKYGIGLCLVSQRTALVSKTLLSQCNTVFAFSMHDETGINYLRNVFSSDHANALPNLKFLQGLAFGAGVNSEQPIMFERKYDEAKYNASQEIPVANPEPGDDLEDSISGQETCDDDIPF